METLVQVTIVLVESQELIRGALMQLFSAAGLGEHRVRCHSELIPWMRVSPLIGASAIRWDRRSGNAGRL